MSTPLGQSGQILVTQAAADAYAVGSRRSLGYEEARRELTELLIGAARKPADASGLEHWRARSRTLGVDVDAHVSREGPLAVVTHVHVRRRG